MKILISNDDGVFAAGIRALAEAFCAEHEVFMVAPDSERSGASHSLTLVNPLRVKKVEIEGLPQVSAYCTSGTPTDCVKLAYGNLGIRPDLVLSGINHGANLGTDVLYSGTVSAAMDAAMLGIPAIAGSVCALEPKHFEPVIDAIKSMIPRALAHRGSLININAPDLPAEEIKGCKFTACSVQEYESTYEERVDTHNQKYYWVPTKKITNVSEEDDTDERWVREGYISIVPLMFDMTDYARLREWKEAE